MILKIHFVRFSSFVSRCDVTVRRDDMSMFIILHRRQLFLFLFCVCKHLTTIESKHDSIMFDKIYISFLTRL